MYTVFISHKQEDAAPARAVSQRLIANGIATYLDLFDPDAKDGPELADYLREKLGLCQGLMAVVTNQTITSWWVPWEIGVASERDMPMATFSYDRANVPSYLRKWPYLTQLDQIDAYADLAKQQVQQRRVLVEKGQVSRERAEFLPGRAFNAALRTRLGQR
jgi:hypothetical protein